MRKTLCLLLSCSSLAALAGEFRPGVGEESLGAYCRREMPNIQTLRAGLAFRVELAGWPSINRWWQQNATYDWTGQSCGEVRPRSDVVFDGKGRTSRDWAHETWLYRYGGHRMEFTVSRLFPGFLISNSSPDLLLFFNQVVMFHGKTVTQPKHLAYASAGGIVHRPNPTSLGPPAMSEPWMLLWNGAESELTGWPCPPDTRRGDASHRYFIVDVPWLVILENKPERVTLDKSGLSFRFPRTAGRVVMMPLYGVRELFKGDTVDWARKLPEEVAARCRKLAAYSRFFPMHVKESYALDDDTLTLKENFVFQRIADAWGTKGVKLAPLPPVVEVARRYGFPMEVSGRVRAMDHMLNGGLWGGVEGVDEYTIKIKGLAKYATKVPRLSPRGGDRKLSGRLSGEIRAIIDAGYLSPYRMQYGKFDRHEVYYWANPAETHYSLALALPLLPPGLQRDVRNHLRSMAEMFPPLEVAATPYGKGTARELYTVPKGVRGAGRVRGARLINLYGTWAYADAAGDWEYVEDSWDVADCILRTRLARRFDWAIGWVARDGWEAQGVAEVNQAISGLIGYVRMAEHLNLREKRDYAMYLLHRVLMTRYALSKYVFALYDTKMRVIPPIFTDTLASASVIDDTKGRPDPRCANWTFQQNLWFYENTQPRRRVWVDASTDLGQASQFGEYRATISSAGKRFYNGARLLALEWITPEVGWFLADMCRDDIRRYYDGMAELWPDWFCVTHEEVSPTEAGIFGPEIPWSMFCAEALVLGADAEALRRHVDIPLCIGDLYYIQKLALTLGESARIAASRPIVSRNVPATIDDTKGRPSPAPPGALPLPPDSMEEYTPPTIFTWESYADYRYVRVDFTRWSKDRLMYVFRTPGVGNKDGAMCELARRNVRKVIPDLLDTVKRTRPGPWSGRVLLALRCLAHFKAQEAVPAVAELFDAKFHLRVRAEAARTLGFIPGEQSVQSLVRGLRGEKEPVVQFCAIVALSQHDLELARESLQDLAEGPDPLLARYAASWLRRCEMK